MSARCGVRPTPVTGGHDSKTSANTRPLHVRKLFSQNSHPAQTRCGSTFESGAREHFVSSEWPRVRYALLAGAVLSQPDRQRRRSTMTGLEGIAIRPLVGEELEAAALLAARSMRDNPPQIVAIGQDPERRARVLRRGFSRCGWRADPLSGRGMATVS